MSKPLDRITLLETFVRIADAGSISAAARDLGLSQPSASRQLAELENRLKAQFMRRNTHSLALTDAGRELLADARHILDSWDALAEKHLSAETTVQGKLKVVAPVALGQRHLVRLACEFQSLNPGVSLTWELDDHPIRFAETGCDCWIRVGPVPDEALIAKRIGAVDRVLVASKAFLEKNGLPDSPKAAERLSLLALDPFEGGRVPVSRNGRTVEIMPPVSMRTNNIYSMKEAAKLGLGMAVLPMWFISDELERGSLIDVLPGWKAPELDIHLAYLPGKHQPLRLRAFIDFLENSIAGLAGIKAV